MPQNRHLLMLGECHINVEVSCTVNLIMYLKGPDRARFHVGDGVDEIQDYLHARYANGFVELCMLPCMYYNCVASWVEFVLL